MPAGQLVATGGGTEVSGQGQEQRATSAAGRTGQGQQFTGLDGQGDVPEDPAPPGPQAQSGRADDRHGCLQDVLLTSQSKNIRNRSTTWPRLHMTMVSGRPQAGHSPQCRP